MPTDALLVEPDWLLGGYKAPPGVYDELRAPEGGIRPQWDLFREAFRHLSADEFQRRTKLAEEQLQENGVTFNAFGEEGESQRPWRLDLLPVVLPPSEWNEVARALDQRARLLNAIIDDLYGEQTILATTKLPPSLLYGHPFYQRSFHGLPIGKGRSLCFYAAELARSPNGQWWVMADRTEAPAGAGFALENRIVSARLMPQVMHKVGVERLAPFFLRLQDSLRRQSPNAVSSPRVVLLSMGPRNNLYFEDVYLARYLGYTLVEGNDLAVRDDQVFLKTLSGLVPVDVIFSRGFESGLDPLELGGGAPQGVSGVLQAIRAGNVAVSNRPGCGLLEAPAFMAYLPGLCRELLGDELITPSIATWWCGDPQALDYAFGRFEDLVIKPALQASGGTEVLPGEMTAVQQAELKAQILSRPHAYVAQETVARSASPVWTGQSTGVGHLAFRCFLTGDDDGYSLMPGGLIRVAPTTAPMQLSISAGAGSKDLWICADRPVEPVSLLSPEKEPVKLRRSGALFPSRVADDLYWLGNALDRAEFLTRLLRAVVERLASESDTAYPELPQLLHAMADQGQIEASFAVEDFAKVLPRLEENLLTSLFDDGESRGLARSIAEMQRLARRTRDWLSADTWQTFNHSATRFKEAGETSKADLGDLLEALAELRVNLASTVGLLADGMIHGPAWRFLEMGRRIERGRNIARLLKSTLLTRQPADKHTLRAVLEVLDCRMTYRSRYLDNLQPNGVLDLAITDETNPNSIGFQLAALSEHVDTLPEIAGTPLRSEEKRLVMAAVHQVRMLTPDELVQPISPELRSSVDKVEQLLKQLSDVLNRHYLVHASSPRQILPENQ
ncbi:MAG: circularly permuted type 2 ATP-grasp protein [Planctomycetaceae bacterium]